MSDHDDPSVDPLMLSFALQRAGFFVGDSSGRDAYADYLAPQLASDDESDLLIKYYRTRFSSADDWRGVMVSQTRNRDKLAAVLRDLRVVEGADPLPSGMEQNRPVFGKPMICAHGKDRRREACHGCDPDTYCPHSTEWVRCDEPDCVAAQDAHTKDLRGNWKGSGSQRVWVGDKPVLSKVEHLNRLLGLGPFVGLKEEGPFA